MLEDKNYINGTAARKLVYDVYEENAVLNARRNKGTTTKLKGRLFFVCCLYLPWDP